MEAGAKDLKPAGERQVTINILVESTAGWSPAYGAEQIHQPHGAHIIDPVNVSLT